MFHLIYYILLPLYLSLFTVLTLSKYMVKCPDHFTDKMIKVLNLTLSMKASKRYNY